MPELQHDDTGWAAINCAAALVTACLEERLDRGLVEGLIRDADLEHFLYDLTAALALGFAANIEAIAKLTDRDPHELWRKWCELEAQTQSSIRPFRR